MFQTMRALSLAFFILGLTFAAYAPVSVPEIDTASGVNAFCLLGGVLLVIRARRR
jgi:Na+-transporting NADH:ubiquinone oxidoreductase subunit NqrB